HLKKGDKVSVIGKNSVNWGIVYLSSLMYGTVIVPILSDFHPNDVQHIINHSDSKLLFCSEQVFESMDESTLGEVEAIFSLKDFRFLYSPKKNFANTLEKIDEKFDEKFGKSFTPDEFILPKLDNNDLAAIVYTSGTTGFSKGVMLQYKSLLSNLIFARINMPLEAGDQIVSFMPLAHAYGCAFEFLFPLTLGCHIHFLGKVPSPKVLLKAFDEIKPRLVLSVPLILEKIYKKQVKPTLDKGMIKFSMKIKPLKNILHKKICDKLNNVFGNNFREIVIGGASLNEEVEGFLRQIGFRYTVGYGMTECGPLISYTGYKTHKFGGVGTAVINMEVKIDSQNPTKEVGEILTRGENVMKGYYKNEEETKRVIDNAGWLRTGDLGLMDEDGFIFIKGRSKSLILGPSGQNIYPEEIEAKLNNMPLVQESLILEKEGRLIGLVYPDYDMIDSKRFDEEKIKEQIEENRKILNEQLPKYSQITKIDLYPEEFEKTPTKKIKRFRYTI
ncbi:MAG TPA: long-chain fatty acid--CoA ligase, partial [Firmicutes bacterium]|nr:long-chain fatty acid--CoA ligase [Bacillota bacterium]